MDIISRKDIERLTEKQDGLCVSVYMPASRTDAEKNRIRFKNLHSKASKKIAALGTGDVNVLNEKMEAIKRLVDDLSFWQYQSDGLALFLSDKLFKTYRLKTAFDEMVIVAERFHIKPLLTCIANDARFYVLALSQGRVRFFRCTRQTIEEVKVENMPRDLPDALKYDDPEKQLQFHTGTDGGGERRPAMFHGHGAGSDDTGDSISQYFREIDKCLHPVIHNDNSPLILAAVDYLIPLYRKANSYSYLLDKAVLGSPDEIEEKELHDKAWDIIELYVGKAQDDAAEMYRNFVGAGKTSKDLEEIVAAAVYGRIAVLFAAKGVQQWGRFDPKDGTVDIHEAQRIGDDDLLDLAAIETFMKDGEVYLVEPDEVPGSSVAAAIFRY